MAGPSKSQCGILQNCWDALQDEIIEHFFCLCTTGLEHPQLNLKEPSRKHFLCQGSSELRNPVELCLPLAHSSHDKQCGVESSACPLFHLPHATLDNPQQVNLPPTTSLSPLCQKSMRNGREMETHVNSEHVLDFTEVCCIQVGRRLIIGGPPNMGGGGKRQCKTRKQSGRDHTPVLYHCATILEAK